VPLPHQTGSIFTHRPPIWSTTTPECPVIPTKTPYSPQSVRNGAPPSPPMPFCANQAQADGVWVRGVYETPRFGGSVRELCWSSRASGARTANPSVVTRGIGDNAPVSTLSQSNQVVRQIVNGPGDTKSAALNIQPNLAIKSLTGPNRQLQIGK
jgi:hypothetical protein